MEENKKKQRRVSFASEAPEQNVYEKELDITSLTAEDFTADLTCEQTKVGKSFYEKEEENKENDSIMSNNTAVFDELVNTQYIRKIVPQEQVVQININELLIEHGIRFLDDIVVSSTRRDTLSKSKKEVDPKNLIYYEHFLSHRIKFFEDFSEYLKNELISLSEQLKEIEMNFNIKNTLLEKEDKSKLRSLKTDCRNRANVSWYELRAKKELEFNELICKIKNDLNNEFNKKETEYEQIRKDLEDTELNIKLINEKIQNINSHEILNVTNQSIDKLQQDILNHEEVLEDYLAEYEKLRIDVNNKKINEESNELKYKNLQDEISELEKQFRTVSVNENDLNEVKNEYEKLTSILGLEILEFKNDKIKIKFLNFEIILTREDFKMENVVFLGSKSIIHEYGVLVSKNYFDFLEVINLLNIINEIYKEIQYILVNNSVDIFIENEELRISISAHDLSNFKNFSIKINIKSNLEMKIEKDNESYFYDLHKDKGCIISHLE
ncbi:uncharacterized protein VNE69_07068 [Vairimorpha necatrix]|uniref:Spc7 kinetochore protein domain-containing protein n=1 Tax=Vairimorpha necatrix TaxID=6039 RepID=A0AAX4JDF5_9MICR